MNAYDTADFASFNEPVHEQKQIETLPVTELIPKPPSEENVSKADKSVSFDPLDEIILPQKSKPTNSGKSNDMLNYVIIAIIILALIMWYYKM